MMLPDQIVWVFNGAGSQFAGGVFTALDRAESWIAHYKLTGVLTAYPLDEGCFDWAIANDCTNISSAKLPIKAADPAFVGSFTTGSQDHHHYEKGIRSS